MPDDLAKQPVSLDEYRLAQVEAKVEGVPVQLALLKQEVEHLRAEHSESREEMGRVRTALYALSGSVVVGSLSIIIGQVLLRS